MKRIVKHEQNHFSRIEMTQIIWESCDGMQHSTRQECVWHEDQIKDHLKFYRWSIKANCFTLDKLKQIYADYEQCKASWQKSTTLWKSFCAGQYALKTVIEETEAKEKNNEN